MKISCWLAAAGAVLLSSGAARADVEGGLELHGVLGAHEFSSRGAFGGLENTGLSTSPLFGARLSLPIGRRLGLEAELGYAAADSGSGVGVGVLAYRGNVLVNLVTGRFRPFVLVGGGAMSGSSEDTAVVKSETKAEFHGGLGLAYDVLDRFGFRLDGRANFNPARGGGLTTDFEMLAGVSYRFGGTSTEPVGKAEVLAKAEPPKPADADQDGVPDAQDGCPDTAKGAKIDAKGCPVPVDTDGDQLVDADDKCPNEAGIADNAGCPDKDGDGDQLVDRLDKCPAEAETRNGYQDEDGCADEVPAIPTQLATLDVTFKGGKDVLAKKSFAKLDKVVAFLKEYPQLRVEVAGHTDDRGKRDRNVELSKRRAEAVASYLASQGIEPARIAAAGYGPDQPVADNKSARGRAKNRRVELRPVTSVAAKPPGPAGGM